MQSELSHMLSHILIRVSIQSCTHLSIMNFFFNENHQVIWILSLFSCWLISSPKISSIMILSHVKLNAFVMLADSMKPELYEYCSTLRLSSRSSFENFSEVMMTMRIYLTLTLKIVSKHHKSVFRFCRLAITPNLST